MHTTYINIKFNRAPISKISRNSTNKSEYLKNCDAKENQTPMFHLTGRN